MTVLMLATELAKRPVVTLAGEAVAQVKDVVYDSGGGRVGAFTLSGRGLFSGPLKQALPWSGVTGLGHAAVMIPDEDVYENRKEVAERSGPGGGDVLGVRVLSDAGVELGRVTDVVIEVTREAATVAGYQIESTEALGHHERTVYLPLAETLAVSGEALVVPALAAEYVAEDLPGFEDMVRAFRTRMTES
ncbi:PRC-barrel domain-containing protein [Streptomyces sp. JJ66]|uniref:PRC-barrel domain-containing protein n=1 Tax=Streptomyces sp. JJ66 TaxID=2803843 RepID=UPI001C5862BC|nr:PRC-barrel domain-containing protein [Streptomyces sp. JJ66]MBW1604501.1 PRC-barrel domain-containing protein [Streptomyces sp. JJ66]